MPEGRDSRSAFDDSANDRLLESSILNRQSSIEIRDRILILTAIAALHLVLMQRYPIIYGGDTIIRLVNHEKIAIAYQLPVLQLLVHVTLRWFWGKLGIWLLMGIVSGMAGAGLYALTWQITQDRGAGRLAAVLYATHAFILFYSLVPYQEPLLAAGIVWGFYYLVRPPSWQNLLLSSLAFGIASLTRYEGWVAAAVAALFHIWEQKKKRGQFALPLVLQSVALFGWAPILWLIWNQGLSPGGTYVLDWDWRWARLYRPYFIAKSSLWWTESAVILLALIGFCATFFDVRGARNRRAHWMLGIFLVLFLSALTVSAHGIEPDPIRIVTEREAFVPLTLLLLYAGVGASRTGEAMQKMAATTQPLLRRGLPALGFLLISLLSFHQGIQRIAAANADPELKTDYEVAQFLAVKKARALVLARPLPRDQVESYLARAEKAGGPQGRKKAEELLREIETTPFDYQRVLVFSWMGRENIISGDELDGWNRFRIEDFVQRRQLQYLVVFADFTPVKEHERILLSLYVEGRSPELQIRNATKEAAVYSLMDGISPSQYNNK